MLYRPGQWLRRRKNWIIESALLENEKVQNIRPLPTVSEGSCEVVPLVSGMDSLDEAVQVWPKL